MDQKTAFYMKLLLNRFHTGPQDALLRLFPEGGDIVLKTATSEKEISHALRNPETLLSLIHYSWIAETLRGLPLEKRPLYIASLPTHQKSQLKKHMELERDVTPLKGPLKKFMQKEFLHMMLPEGHMPYAYQLKSSLAPLLTLPKTKIIQLIDFLGLYDLAEELKKTVDTKLLKSLYLVLTPKQKEFLKGCMHQKDKFHSPAFPLNDWSGDEKDLEVRLHKRGLLRLAKALSGQDPSFVWTFIHSLDTGRGKRLEGMISKEEVPQVTEFMISKVLYLIKFLDKE